MKKVLSALVAAAGFFALACGGPSGGGGGVNDNRGLSPFEYSLMNLAGTDAAGRRVEPVESHVKDRTVGIFYSVWLGGHTSQQTDIYDVQALLATEEGRAALDDMSDNPASRLGQFHFSSRPLYGYYSMEDPWVVARHVELLTACGLDYLCIDATNSVLYLNATRLLLDTLLGFYRQGFSVPKVMFYTNSESGTTVTRLYNEFYRTETYNEIWWAPNGKPMIVGITENSRGASDQTRYPPGGVAYTNFVTPAMKEFFDVAESQWPQGLYNDDAFPWMDWSYPQRLHGGPQSMSVSIAQHSPTTVYMSDMHEYSSRGYDHRTGVRHSDWEKGQNFQSEWDTALSTEGVKNVLVTGWNEWMAIKSNNNGKAGFVDAYNEEYSRDAEMSAGRYKDNFYMQLVKNVRAFKYEERTQKYAPPSTAIDIESELSLVQWDYVNEHYKDFSGEVMPRNFRDAVGKNTYTDFSNRNDITDVKVAHNNDYLWFYIKTKDPVTEHAAGDKGWMNVLISTGRTAGFEGYDYVVNRMPEGGVTSVERSAGGYTWQSAGSADYRVYGNVLLIKIPLSALGLTGGNCAVEFKVTDNITHPDDIMDYYVSGESVPIGRLSFSYGK